MNRVRPPYLGMLVVLAALLSVVVLSPTQAQTNADAVDLIWPTATPSRPTRGHPYRPCPRNVSGQNDVEIVALDSRSDGVPMPTRTITLDSAQVQGVHQSTDTALGDNWEGSIVLEATQDIVAMMREETSTTFAACNGISR